MRGIYGVDGGTHVIESWMVFVGVGAIGGFFVGRATAEVRRARADMRNTWNGRKRYRS